jgi:hypothetical protein
MTHHQMASTHGPAMRRWRIGWCLAFMLVTLTGAHAEDRWRSHQERDFPYTERFEGERRWDARRAMPRGWDMPDRIVIDRPGKCEVRCERRGREYRCKEYRC